MVRVFDIPISQPWHWWFRFRRSGTRVASLFVGVVIFTISFGILADTPTNARAYPAEALTLAEVLVPELADSLKTCNVEKARSVNDQANEFMYKRWNWYANYERLKAYRPCYQMLSDIAASTQLITNRFLNAHPTFVAGMFDPNYASCRKLVDSTYKPVYVSNNMQWPSRFGPEPSSRSCVSALTSTTSAAEGNDIIGIWKLQSAEGERANQFPPSLTFSFNSDMTCSMSFVDKDGSAKKSQWTYQLKEQSVYMWLVGSKKLPEVSKYSVVGGVLTMKNRQENMPALIFSRVQ